MKGGYKTFLRLCSQEVFSPTIEVMMLIKHFLSKLACTLSLSVIAFTVAAYLDSSSAEAFPSGDCVTTASGCGSGTCTTASRDCTSISNCVCKN